MTFPEIWDQLCRKRPELKNDSARVEFTAANLRALLRQVYEKAQEQHKAAAPKQATAIDELLGMFNSFKG